jgi:hypothetical protein
MMETDLLPAFISVPAEFIKELEEKRDFVIAQMEHAVDKEELYRLAGKASALNSVINRLKDFKEGVYE